MNKPDCIIKGDKVITIKDIAKKAKISVTTVSRALNDFDDVNIETKKKIKKIHDQSQIL